MSEPTLFDNLTLEEPRKAGLVEATSVAVARELDGYVNQRERMVLEFLDSWFVCHDAPPTSAELATFRDDKRPRHRDLTWWRLLVRRGLSGLKDHRLAAHGPTRKCRTAKRPCVTWQLVSR